MANINDYQIDLVKNSFVVVATDTAAIVTAAKAAAVGRHHIICKVDASYSSSTQSGELTILFGTTVVARKHVHSAGAVDFGIYGFQNPTANQAVSAVLAAGAGGVVGDVVLTGYTTGVDA